LKLWILDTDILSLFQRAHPLVIQRVMVISKRLFEKYLAVILGTHRSPLAPLKKGGTGIKVPLFKGDLGGSKMF
jgi:hypothetical protein